MIKLTKDISAIPMSLIPAFEDFFSTLENVPVLSKNTHDKRMEIINNGAYIDNDVFNNRYKKQDIRTSLENIYKNKCAYCEQKVEQYHIEHYRPKKIYYWLAFSWDNLIMACSDCNQNKGVNFDLLGTFKNFINTEANIRNINCSSADQDLTEKPKMINPEVTDPFGKIIFQKDGLIKSNDICFAYTIQKCKIDRDYLNDERRKLLNNFKDHIRVIMFKYSNISDQIIGIESIVSAFISDSKDSELQFLAFRRYAISSGWLGDLIKEMN